MTQAETKADEPVAWTTAEELKFCTAYGSGIMYNESPRGAPADMKATVAIPLYATPPEKHRHTAEVEALREKIRSLLMQFDADIIPSGVQLAEAIAVALATQPTPTTAEKP